MNKVWRCPICKRLLSFIDGETLEIETRNRQIIKIKSISYEAICKCGLHIRYTNNIKSLIFHKKA